MGQCQLALAHEIRGKACCLKGQKTRGGRPALQSAPTAVGAEALPEQLRILRERGLEVLRARPGTDSDRLEELWATASDLMDAVLLGIVQHHPRAVRSVALGDGAADVSITVEFADAPLVGEFATRSRQPCELHVAPTLGFSLELGGEGTLRLATRGLSLSAMPGVDALRDQLADELGDAFDMHTAWDWWQANREDRFALERSKLRRVCASMPSSSLMPKPFLMQAFWGYLNFFGRSLEAFDFSHGPAGVLVSGQMRLCDAAETATPASRRAAEVCRATLQKHGAMAAKFAASSVAMAAFFEGGDASECGVKAAQIVKLFSAAQTWGPGKDSWHVHDDTWTCVDKKDALGRVTAAQGRVIWRMPSAAAAADAPAAPREPTPVPPTPVTAVKAAVAGGGSSAAGGRSTPCAALLMLMVVLLTTATEFALADGAL